MSVRCKMTVTSITENLYGNPGARVVKFQACYDPSIPEDARFQAATPNAEMTAWVENPKALEQFKIGTAFYVDFTPAPDPIPAK